jgi:hypothetical protein
MENNNREALKNPHSNSSFSTSKFGLRQGHVLGRSSRKTL